VSWQGPADMTIHSPGVVFAEDMNPRLTGGATSSCGTAYCFNSATFWFDLDAAEETFPAFIGQPLNVVATADSSVSTNARARHS